MMHVRLAPPTVCDLYPSMLESAIFRAMLLFLAKDGEQAPPPKPQRHPCDWDDVVYAPHPLRLGHVRVLSVGGEGRRGRGDGEGGEGDVEE